MEFLETHGNATKAVWKNDIDISVEKEKSDDESEESDDKDESEKSKDEKEEEENGEEKIANKVISDLEVCRILLLLNIYSVNVIHTINKVFKF